MHLSIYTNIELLRSFWHSYDLWFVQKIVFWLNDGNVVCGRPENDDNVVYCFVTAVMQRRFDRSRFIISWQ